MPTETPTWDQTTAVEEPSWDNTYSGEDVLTAGAKTTQSALNETLRDLNAGAMATPQPPAPGPTPPFKFQKYGPLPGPQPPVLSERLAQAAAAIPAGTGPISRPAASLARTALQFGAGATAPENISQAGLFLSPPGAAAAGVYYGAQAIKGAHDSIKRVRDLMNRPGPVDEKFKSELSDALVDAEANIAVAGEIGAGLGRGVARNIPRPVGREFGQPRIPRLEPLEFTGEALPGRPQGATPVRPTAGPEVLGPPVPPQRVRTMPEGAVTEPEPGREVNMLQEIRDKGIRTKKEVLALFPDVASLPNPRERAAAILRQAYPPERQGPPVPPGGVQRPIGVRTGSEQGPLNVVSGQRPVVEPMRVRQEPVFQGPEIPPEVQAQREREANMQRELDARRSALQQNIIFWERELEMAQNRGDKRGQDKAVQMLLDFRRELEAIPPVKEIAPKPPIARAPGSAFRPEVPGTAAETDRTTVASTVRAKNIKTVEGLLNEYPKMRGTGGSREWARSILREVWGAFPPGVVQGPPLPPPQPPQQPPSEEPPAAPPAEPVPKPPGAPPAAPAAVEPPPEPLPAAPAPETPPTPTPEAPSPVPEAPVEPAKPATIEDTPIAGKTLAEWEQVRDASQLPKGNARAELAKWLAVPNQPSRILQALGNKKRTREIHAPPVTEVAPVAPGAPQSQAPPATVAPETAPAERAAAQQQDVALQRQLKGAAEPTASTETPAEQKKGFDTKEAKQQKSFLLEHIDDAIGDANDDPIGAWQNLELETDWNNAQNATDPKWRKDNPGKAEALADKYGVPTEVPESTPYTDLEGKTQRAEKGHTLSMEGRVMLLKRAISDANFAAAPKVTIEVPGDGTFDIINSKAALEDFREKAASFPTTAPRAKVESKTARGTPTAAPTLGKLDKDNALRAAKLFSSTDASRLVLNYGYSDGKKTIATDGRRLIEINTGTGGTAKKPAFVKLNDKAAKLDEDAKFPTYSQVIPTDDQLTEVFSGLDAARMFNLVEQARQVTTDRANSIVLWRNTDGSIGITAHSPDIGSYEHNIKKGAKSIGAYKPDYLSDIFSAARVLGDDKVDFHVRFEDGKHAELNPIVVKGKNFKAVLMPMRMNGEAAEALTAKDLKGKPSMGPGAAAAAEFDEPMPPPDPAAYGLSAGNRWWNDRVREYNNMVEGFAQLDLFGKKGRGAQKNRITQALNAANTLPRVLGQQAGNSFRLMLSNIREQNAVTALMQAMKMSGQGLEPEDLERLQEQGKLECAGDPMGYLKANQTDLETYAQEQLNKGMKLEAQAAIDLAQAMQYARDNFAKLKPIATEAKKRLDQQLLSEEARGLETDYERWYVPQRHDLDLMPAAGRPIVLGDSKGAGPSSQFRKAKFYEDYSSAIQAGFIPRSLSIADLLEHRVMQGERLAANKAMFESLKRMRDPRDNKPIGINIPKRKITRPDGTTDIREAVPLDYEPFTVMPGVRMAVHKGYARMLRALTGDSAASESALVSGLQNVAAFEKHVGLAIDTFHLVRTLATELATTGRVSVGSRLQKGTALLEYDIDDLNKAVQRGQISQATADWVTKPQKWEVHGKELEASPRAIVNLGMKNGLNVGRIADNLYKDWITQIPGIGRLLGGFNKLVFQKMTRSAMTHSFLLEFNRVAKQHPEWTGDQAARKVASDINVLFGNLQKESWIRSPTLNAIAQITFLAPNWVQSRIRAETRGALQLAEAGGRLLRGKPIQLETAGKTVGTGLLASFAIAQLVNLATRGHLTFQNEEEGHQLDAFLPDPYGGHGFFFSPLAMFAEIMHDVVRYSYTKPDMATAVDQILKNKLGNLGRALLVLGLGRDPYTDEKIIGTENRISQTALQAIPLPIIGSTAARTLLAPMVPGTQRPTTADIERQAYSSFGVKVEPAPSASSQIRRMVDEWKMTQEPKLQQDVERRLKEEFRSTYSDLRGSLSRGDMGQAGRAYHLMRSEGATPQQIRKTINHPAPFAGSKALERRFFDSLTPQQQQVYERALVERELIQNRFQQMLETQPQLEE